MESHTQRAVDRSVEAGEQVREQVREKLQEVKPQLRGWLHAATAPLALAAGIVLIVLSPTPATRIGSAIFAASALALFTASATMHRGTWSERTGLWLRRLDHSSIFLLIAGSYTPFTLILLEGEQRVTLLAIAWGGAALGILFRLFWTGAPRWLYTPIYIMLGWAAVFYFPAFFASAKAATITCLVVGGLLYTIGGFVYGFRWPNPSPRWFGFHEVFHTLTIIAFATHYVGVSIATYSLR
ncbi:MAG TPA: hemolysin III family protein [Nocardioidaceae bacterium]|jgi:hemolysin III|nr:hemolysin III family protein [Nocardioidaceae bacterium]